MDKIRSILIVLLLFQFGVLSVANADGGSNDPAAVPVEITELLAAGEFDQAIVKLSCFVKSEKKNADAWNLLGYSQRKTGDLDSSLTSYKKALRINRKHLGANEYLGELYIMRGELDKAKKQLKKLEKYCHECEEYHTLAEAIKNGSGSW